MENWDKFSGVEKRKEIYIPNIFQIWCCWPQWMTEGMFFTLGRTEYLSGKTSGLRPNTETETECTIYVKIRGDFAYLANSLIFSLFDCAKNCHMGAFFSEFLLNSVSTTFGHIQPLNSAAETEGRKLKTFVFGRKFRPLVYHRSFVKIW